MLVENYKIYLTWAPWGDGLDVISGILSAVSASFILGNGDAHTGTKAAAGIELTSQVLGNVGAKLFSNIFWLRREWHRAYRQQLQVRV